MEDLLVFISAFYYAKVRIANLWHSRSGDAARELVPAFVLQRR